MRAQEKFERIFGSISSLSEEVPWTTGLSNMIEYLLWDTKYVLGISKTQLCKFVVSQLYEEDETVATLDAKQKFVKKTLAGLIKENDALERYAKPKSGYCSPNEALRRAKFFSEDYLNKEFDIFLNLSSDAYLDTLYSQLVSFKHGERWSTHGNSGLFRTSTQIGQMQMDNLAYNDIEGLLVANELKFGGRKNPDQLLKYAFMYLRLAAGGFIGPETTFLFLVISDKPESIDRKHEIAKEMAYCESESKEFLLEPKVIRIAREMLISSTTWSDLLAFNNSYAESLKSINQVEKKLLAGFNTALREKAFLRNLSA